MKTVGPHRHGVRGHIHYSDRNANTRGNCELEIPVVTVRQIVIASAVVAMSGTACTEDVAKASTDCASLLAQYDQGVSVASAEYVSAATAARDQGEQICLDGKTEEGAAKLIEAISRLSPGAPDESGSPT